MTRPTAQFVTLSALSARQATRPALACWGLEALVGRLSELSGLGPTARLSLAESLICEAQRVGETAAWITNRRSTFFPPDAAANGADLARLPVVFAPDAPTAARAAWRLVQSGGFGLVVLDLVGTDAAVPVPLQSRLAAAAQAHGAAIVFVTEKTAERASLGSLVSLRCEASREEAGAGRYLCTARALKDKRRGPGWTHTEVRRGPAGLR
jgi:recombination protein RecA